MDGWISGTIYTAESKRKAAFTLAEVLITLGIIGVVAALTMPMLISNYQKKAAVSALKKMYSTLMQASQMYQSQHEITIEQFDTSLSAKDFMNEYINPYVKVVKECTGVAECYVGKTPLAIDRNTALSVEYLTVLADGSYLGISYSAASGKVFYFDINGSKGPNYSGRDIFYFYLINKSTIQQYERCNNEECRDIMNNLQSGIYPGSYSAWFAPYTWYTREELLGTSIHRSCNRNAARVNDTEGDACAALIMRDGWEIRNDYPW